MIKTWKVVTCITFLALGLVAAHFLFHHLDQSTLVAPGHRTPWTPYVALLTLASLASLRIATWSIKGIKWARRLGTA